jgi:hypothetical protein
MPPARPLRCTTSSRSTTAHALDRFEEYRDLVRARAAQRCGEGTIVEECFITDDN